MQRLNEQVFQRIVEAVKAKAAEREIVGVLVVCDFVANVIKLAAIGREHLTDPGSFDDRNFLTPALERLARQAWRREAILFGDNDPGWHRIHDLGSALSRDHEVAYVFCGTANDPQNDDLLKAAAEAYSMPSTETVPA